MSKETCVQICVHIYGCMHAPRMHMFDLIFNKRKSMRAVQAHVQESCLAVIPEKALDGDVRERETKRRREKRGRDGM